MSDNKDADTQRITLSLPVETIRQITSLAAASGVKRSQFMAMALVLGAKTLVQMGAAGPLGVDVASSEERKVTTPR